MAIIDEHENLEMEEWHRENLKRARRKRELSLARQEIGRARQEMNQWKIVVAILVVAVVFLVVSLLHAEYFK